MKNMSYVDTISFSKNYHTLLFEIFLYIFGLSLLIISSYISIKIPISIVPITGQTIAVLVIGSTYGPRRAFVTLSSYLIFGAIGFEVFSGGASGIAALTGATGGYLIGFLIASVFMGFISNKYNLDKNFSSSLMLYLIGHKIIFLFGVLWLSHYIGLRNALITGFLPFIPGEIIKSMIASSISKSLWGIKK